MKSKLLFLLVAGLLVFTFTSPVLAQVALRTGSVFGKVVDDKGAPLPGVNITIESDVIVPQTATSGPTGGFRFANLPPGTYSVTFRIEGFTEVRQEDVRVTVGGTIDLNITLKPTLQEEFVVVADTPVVDTKETGITNSYDREYLDQVPSGRDPWVIIEQTPGVDVDRFSIAGSEAGQQSGFWTRGASDNDNVWNYDGINITDPAALASPTYYDFDSFEEISIATGGMDASVGNQGVAVNLVTKRAGNKWEANASGYFVNSDLQSDNTPDEIASGGTKSNRIDQIYDIGFDIGGPIVKDRLFVWGALRKNQVDLFTRTGLSDKTTLEDRNFKANFNFNSENETQFGYFFGDKAKDGRGFDPPNQQEDTLWVQGGAGEVFQGIWTGQHTWIPNDHAILSARYGYIGNDFALTPKGGGCVPGSPCEIPMIYLSAISNWEDTSFNYSTARPTKDFNVDYNYFKENWAGGDHEFKFGFNYRTFTVHSISTYGNGLWFYDFYQTVEEGPLTTGLIFITHELNIDGRTSSNSQSFYATDTFRMDRLTLNLGFRYDTADGKNLASTVPGPPAGFEAFLSPIVFAGNDLSKRFNDFAPRIGATYDVTGDGKTIVRGNYARYTSGYNVGQDTYSNPTFVYQGGIGIYVNSDADRNITADEIAAFLGYYGGASPNFNLDEFLAVKQREDLSSQKTDEFSVGFEREVVKDMSLSVTYTYRTYDNFIADVPFDVQADDFVPGGVVNVTNELGTFVVPYSVLGFTHDGTHNLQNIDGYSQTYNGVDIAARKRMSNNFMLNGSFTWQDQKAHYEGGDSFLIQNIGDGVSGVNFTDPSSPFFDGEAYAFASSGSGKSGIYPYAEWSFRSSGVYQFPADFTAGAFVRYIQGYPMPLFHRVTDTSLANFYGTSGHNVLLAPIDTFRHPNIFTLDLNVQKSFQMSDYGRLTLALDMFNITNSNTTLQRERRTSQTTFQDLQENLPPRAVRLGVKYSF
jgi:hypothetical protein